MTATCTRCRSPLLPSSSSISAGNLVRGDGLTYNHIEARAEGYSNFLHVLVASAIYAGAAATAALATIAFAGPVALWSASSLETVPFALMVVLFAARQSLQQSWASAQHFART